MYSTLNSHLLRILRRVLGIPQPLITRHRAVELALQECKARSVKRLENAGGTEWVIEHLRNFEVCVNPNECFGMVWVWIDATTGRVQDFQAWRGPR